MWHDWSSIGYWSLFIICNYLYLSVYYSYLIKVGLSGVRKLEIALHYLIYVVRLVQKLGLVYSRGGQTFFCLRAKFENIFLLGPNLSKLVTIFAKPKFFQSIWCLLRRSKYTFCQILSKWTYIVCFSK